MRKNKKKLVEITCDYCGEKSLREKWRIGKQKNLFCNRTCHAEYKKKNTPLMPKRCAQCKKFFSVKKIRKDQKYCSAECSFIAKRGRNQKDIKCSFCGKVFQLPYRNQKGSYFCSHSCASLSKNQEKYENNTDVSLMHYEIPSAITYSAQRCMLLLGADYNDICGKNGKHKGQTLYKKYSPMELINWCQELYKKKIKEFSHDENMILLANLARDRAMKIFENRHIFHHRSIGWDTVIFCGSIQ